MNFSFQIYLTALVSRCIFIDVPFGVSEEGANRHEVLVSFSRITNNLIHQDIKLEIEFARMREKLRGKHS